ncbi:transposase [Actinomadura madurae]|uniref:transposase n=1 Tax=Actinomadura madurae TaxID=1993 RepID=UPI003557929C
MGDPARPRRPGRPSKRTRRQLIDGIRRRVRTGAPGRDVPDCHGSWQAVYGPFRRPAARRRPAAFRSCRHPASSGGPLIPRLSPKPTVRPVSFIVAKSATDPLVTAVTPPGNVANATYRRNHGGP